MSGARKQRTGFLRHVVMTMAALAIMLKVLVPAGYMVSQQRTNEAPFPIVLCTLQGMVEVQPGAALPGQDHSSADPSRAASAEPCVFAGLSIAGPAPETVSVRPSQAAVYHPLLPPTEGGVSKPAGHAGPPLPARGPPTHLI